MKTQSYHVVVVGLLLSMSVMQSCKKSDDSATAKLSVVQTSKGIDSLVDTPFGKISSSQVFYDDPGTAVSVQDGRVIETDKITGKKVRDFGPYLGDQVSTVPTFANLSTATAGAGDGYYCSASLPAGDTVKVFKTKWIVPSAPDSTKTLFLWNGLAGGALQPVLSWDNGQGKKWYISNWYYLSGYHQGPKTFLTPGTQVEGVITLNSYSTGAYNYTESFTGYPASDVTFTRTTLATGLAQCFEPYVTFSSTAYLCFPNDLKVSMTNINCLLTNNTHPATLSWSIRSGYLPTPSGKNTVIVSNSSTSGQVDFYFQ
jgi:hypothetical protein